jgi:hypothetical protein
MYVFYDHEGFSTLCGTKAFVIMESWRCWLTVGRLDADLAG